MLLREAFEALYRPRNLRFASPETIRLWNIALRMFDKFLKRSSLVDDLRDETLISFAAWRRERCAAATVNRDLASLLALWRYLHRKGIVVRWPDVPLEPEPIRVPIAWTQDEFERLLRTTRKARGFVGSALASHWWSAIVLVCFDSGERIGAVLGVGWDDVDLSDNWLIFKAENRKGRDRDSVVKIAADTSAAIKQIPRDGKCVFSWPFTRQYLWKRYGALLQKAELPADRRRKFHCIRRTVASHAEAAGGNATELLRHAARKNTLAYLDPRITKPQQAVDYLWRPA